MRAPLPFLSKITQQGDPSLREPPRELFLRDRELWMRFAIGAYALCSLLLKQPLEILLGGRRMREVNDRNLEAGLSAPLSWLL